MQPKYNPIDPRTVLFRDQAQAKIMAGAEKVYQVAKAAYGSGGGNVLLQKPWGNPVLSRDGVTNVRDIYLKDPAEDQAARILVQASDKNNQTVGDGTTAVVILAYHLLKLAQKQVGAGFHPMVVSRKIKEAGDMVVDQVEALKKQIDPDTLKQVATISAGDEALGEMIADTIKQIGKDGGVLVQPHAGRDIINEIVDGFHFKKGFGEVKLINNFDTMRAEYEDVAVLVADRRMSTVADLAPILDKILSSTMPKKELVIVGDVAEEALMLLAQNRDKIIVTPVQPPSFAGARTLFLEDLATVVGGKPYFAGAEPFNLEMLGMAKQVVITEHSTTIIGGIGKTEEIQARIDVLNEQLKTAEHPTTITALKERIARLTGKIATILVGGATELEMKEAKLRVDDAVCAVQAALEDGVVPGGGVTLARIQDSYIAEALKQPFIQLAENAGEDASELLYKVIAAPEWRGFNLREVSDEPIDMYTEGILDPAKVVKQTVINACSIAASLITTNAMVVFSEKSNE